MSMHENQPEPLPKTNLFLITNNKDGCRIYQYSHNLSDNAYGPALICPSCISSVIRINNNLVHMLCKKVTAIKKNWPPTKRQRMRPLHKLMHQHYPQNPGCKRTSVVMEYFLEPVCPCTKLSPNRSPAKGPPRATQTETKRTKSTLMSRTHEPVCLYN
jgi:hypothetical protein